MNVLGYFVFQVGILSGPLGFISRLRTLGIALSIVDFSSRGYCGFLTFSGSPSSWIDVLERVEDPRTGRLVVTGNTYAPNLKCLKRNLSSRHCLNMGSYNYLGFGGVHELITPQIIKTAFETGVGLRTPRKICGNDFSKSHLSVVTWYKSGTTLCRTSNSRVLT